MTTRQDDLEWIWQRYLDLQSTLLAEPFISVKVLTQVAEVHGAEEYRRLDEEARKDRYRRDQPETQDLT